MTQESNQEMALQIFKEADAILTGSHVVYSSGKHGDTYINKDAVYQRPSKVACLCRMVAECFSAEGVEVVVAPAVGGAVLSHLTASYLGAIRGLEVLAIFAEKSADHKRFMISRGYDKVVAGKRILVVEDVLTTGATARMVVEVVRSLGGEVIGLGALCNRGGVTAEHLGDIPKFVSLVNLQLNSWNAKDCPMCAERIPFNTGVGHAASLVNAP